MSNCVESTLSNVDPICPNMCHICHLRFGDNMLWVSPGPYTKQLGRTTEKACQVVTGHNDTYDTYDVDDYQGVSHFF